MEGATAHATLESFSPATGESLGAVQTLPPEQVPGVVAKVAEVQPFWAQLPLADRARYMRRTAQVLIDHLDELTRLLSSEQGKPLAEAYTMELVPTIDALHWIADNGPKILADQRVRYSQPYFLGKRSWHTFDPLGVIAVIAPWNYPWSIPFGEVATALMCGNGVVLKPASLTPLIGDRIQWAFERAGLPDGIVCTVHGDAALEQSAVAKVFFTGSVEAGRRVGAACAERGKAAVLELGGKDPMLVLADADLDNAVAGCMWGGFANAGQSGSAIERVYVVRELAEPFTRALVEGASRLRVGDPLSWDVEVGPLASTERFAAVRTLVDDAVGAGAKLECGGPIGDGPFFAPAVLTGVTHDMRIMREEVFGPVVPVMAVRDEDEAIELANDSEFGLGASVWTADRDKGRRIARRIEAGNVWINDHMYSHGAMQCSWGGVKSSGVGRTHSRFGFQECVNVKHVAYEPGRLRNFWWYPYDESLGRAVHAAAQLLYGRDDDKRAALRDGAGPLIRLGRRMLGR
ncbi:MAG: hypothetical protein QOG63_351 [Thermoleophilaceae bacterium]|nr:hypothetical protein [Thermoleophilaceae bacterium]